MKKLSKIKAPAVAGVIREKNALSAIAEMRNCLLHGADMIDLHLSCLDSCDVEYLKKIISSTKLPVLALNYNKSYDWSDMYFSEETRVLSLLNAVEAGVGGVDIQGYTYHLPSKTAFCGENKYSFTKNGPKEVVTDENIIKKQCNLIEKVHSMGAEVLLSCHPGISMSCDEVVDLALFLEKRNPDIIKIVSKAENEDDLAESIKTMLVLKKEIKTPISYHANGKFGDLSRIINPTLGGQIAFCVDRYTEGSTMEQIDLSLTRAVVDGVRKITGDI